MPIFPTDEAIAPGRPKGNLLARSRSRSEAEKRRGVRVNSCVPIAVEWDAEGESLRGEARTRIVGPYGCMAVVPHRLDVAQRIRLVNLVSSKTNPAVVVWRGHERAEGWEMGIELIDPEMNFWGLDL
jgi:hypothetical protein